MGNPSIQPKYLSDLPEVRVRFQSKSRRYLTHEIIHRFAMPNLHAKGQPRPQQFTPLIAWTWLLRTSGHLRDSMHHRCSSSSRVEPDSRKLRPRLASQSGGSRGELLIRPRKHQSPTNHRHREVGAHLTHGIMYQQRSSAVVSIEFPPSKPRLRTQSYSLESTRAKTTGHGFSSTSTASSNCWRIISFRAP